MRSGLYPKIAAEGVKKNGKLYIPYFVTCIMMVAVFYIMHFLGYSGVLDNIAGGATATQMLQMGSGIMAIFGTIFMFYTQSTLIKGRKKEFGLYSILGMNRRNIGKIIFYETVITWTISILGGLVGGIGLSKLAELGFTRMIGAKIDYSFNISWNSAGTAILLYTGIFFLIYLNALRQIRFSSAVELVKADRAGEKPPKSNWAVGLLGILFLGAGYYLALKIEQPISALMWFFVAVILVILGTYLVLIAGSVILCRLLQKNTKYYYKAEHFVSVSSMAFRMKRNGAGLASICILLTMILVMLSSTSALFINSDKILSLRYPNEIGAFACKYGYDTALDDLGDRLDDRIFEVAEKDGGTLTDNKTYSVYSISGYFENNKLDVILDFSTPMSFIDYDNVAQVQFMDVDVYNRVFDHNEVVAPGDAIVGCVSDVDIGDTLTVGDLKFNVKGRIDDRLEEIDPAVEIEVSPTIYVIVNDVNEVASCFTDYLDFNGIPMLAWFWYCRFDTGLTSSEQIKLSDDINQVLYEELEPLEFDNYYCDSHAAERGSFLSTFGGLFFLGILLSLIFLVCCVLIIYYKQISEGFEDRSRFEIMQKVGMTKKDIKKSINSQMLTVFMVPIILACVHLAVVLPIVHKLLILFGLNDIPSLIMSACICVLAFGSFYALIYKFTSNEYYRIVS